MNDLNLYKLIILYLLYKVDFPMTSSQISDFILGEGYTTYFKLQTSLAQLQEAGLVSVEQTHNRSLYDLTLDGADTILHLSTKISPAIRLDIHHYLQKQQLALKEEAGVQSNYRKIDQDEYEVHCQIKEGEHLLLDLKMIVPTEMEAKAMANHWISKHQDVYCSLLGSLL